MTKLSTLPKSQPYIITMGQFLSKHLDVYTIYTICIPSGIPTYSPDAPRFKGTNLAFTGTTPTRKHPKKWDSLLRNLPATQMGGEHMMVAMSREEADLRCRQAQKMLERNSILMLSRGLIR